MILAAGRGTRLLPITEQVPKALVEVGGIPMIERVARRLIDAGTTRLVINVHHLGDLVRRYIDERDGFGVPVCISEERELLLDTGGGVANAGHCFTKSGPFLLHNVDVHSSIDLGELYVRQLAGDAIATLAVMQRDATRHLMFDDLGLCGHGNSQRGTERLARSTVGTVRRLGFCGIHAVSERLFDRFTETGAFSIIDVYMRLAGEGEVIQPYLVEDGAWMDIGTHEQLQRANEEVMR